ncbi:MAG: HAD hydrolase-like protein, partial [Gammaproteobacteria bacterium]
LPEHQQAFYELRLLAKRGRDCDDIPVDGGQPMKKGNVYYYQSSTEAAAICAQAGRAVVENPLRDQFSHHMSHPDAAGDGYKKFYESVLNKLQHELEQKTDKPIVVRILRPSRDHRRADFKMNYLTAGFQRNLCDILNRFDQDRIQENARNHSEPSRRIIFDDRDYLSTLSRSTRAEATPIARIAHQGYSSADNIVPNGYYIVSDDHVETGSSLIAAAERVHVGGGQLLAAAAFSAHPISSKGLFDHRVVQELKHKLSEVDPHKRILDQLNKMGLPLDKLTKFEVLIVLALLTDGRDQASVDHFKGIVADLEGDAKAPDSLFNSLDTLLLEPMKSPDELVQEIQATEHQAEVFAEAIKTKNVVVFDWDETLSTEAEIIFQALQQTIRAELGAQVDLESYLDADPELRSLADFTLFEKQFHSTNCGKRDLVEQCRDRLERHPIHPISVGREALYRKFKAHYLNRMQAVDPRMFPGAEDAVRSLKSAETELVVVSNKPINRLTAQLKKAGLYDWFSSIVGAETVYSKKTGKVENRLPTKPAPDMLCKALDDIGIRPHQKNTHVVIIGDSEGDMQAARGLQESGFSSVNAIHFKPCENTMAQFTYLKHHLNRSYIGDMQRSGSDFLINGDRYTIMNNLGRGFTSEVSLLRCEKTGEQLAIKKFYPLRSVKDQGDMASAPPVDFNKKHKLIEEQEEDFDEEIAVYQWLDTLREQSSPHLSKARAIARLEGERFIVTPYYEGGNLRNFIDRLDQAQASGVVTSDQRQDISLYFARHLLLGIETLSKNFVHRDVKPNNTLIAIDRDSGGCSTHRLVICDYGACIANTDEFPRKIPRVPYSPLEVVVNHRDNRGGPYSSALDIWSIGIFVHELLTGTRAFEVQNPTPDNRIPSQETRELILQNLITHAQNPSKYPILPHDSSRAGELVKTILTASTDTRPCASALLQQVTQGLDTSTFDRECNALIARVLNLVSG